jgi:phage FluMu gp28-like protein
MPIASLVQPVRRIKLDARGNGQYLAEQAAYRYGELVEQVMLSVGYYRENMPKLKAWLEDDLLIYPKHEDIITDLGQIQIIRGVPSIDDSRTKGTDGNKRHGDSAIAIFLALMASFEEVVIYAVHRIKQDLNSRKPDEDDSRRQFKQTRGLKSGGGLL